MNRIDQTFSLLKQAGKKALIGYVTAGFPTKEIYLKIVPRLQTAGLDLLEIGVPFSDPVADGTTIQHASQIALENGVTLDWVLHSVKALRRHVQLPIILMSYSNPLLAMGLKRFYSRAQAAGVDGLIVPDLTPDEGKPFEEMAVQHGLDLIYLAAPTTPKERLQQIVRSTRGFLYAVSLTGVTGARSALSATLPAYLTRLRRETSKPIAVGFGISTPAHIASVRRQVDGVIVASALINHLEKSAQSAVTFVTSMQRALNQPHRKGVAHAS